MTKFSIFSCALLVACISTTNAMRAPSANISESKTAESGNLDSSSLDSSKSDSDNINSNANPSTAKAKGQNTAHPHDISTKKPTLIKIDSAFDEQTATNTSAQKATKTASVTNATNTKRQSLADVFIINLAYDSEANFMERNIYAQFDLHDCYVDASLLPPLKKLASALKKRALKLIIYDCYRPQEAQEYAWSIMPDSRYVANPARGSMHTKGRAIDVSLADKNGAPLPMPSHFDAFDKSAHPSYQCKKDEAHKCQNRDLLRALMLESGFKGISSEWWHFWH